MTTITKKPISTILLDPTQVVDANPLVADEPLKNTLCCFVADTDSHHLVIDTSANHIIVSNAKLLTKFKVSYSDVKGVGGSSTPIKGTGMYMLILQSDDGSYVSVNLDAVHVPTSPYNLLPPQLMVSQMKKAGFLINHFKHNESELTIYTQISQTEAITLETTHDSYWNE